MDFVNHGVVDYCVMSLLDGTSTVIVEEVAKASVPIPSATITEFDTIAQSVFTYDVEGPLILGIERVCTVSYPCH